jgi:hypothetical protein
MGEEQFGLESGRIHAFAGEEFTAALDGLKNRHERDIKWAIVPGARLGDFGPFGRSQWAIGKFLSKPLFALFLCLRRFSAISIFGP